MELNKKQKTFKYIIFCLILIGCSLIQNVSGLSIEIGNARCFLLIPMAVILGINEDEKVAGLLGLFGGMLWDTVSGQHLGFNCAFLMVVCFFSASFVTYIFRDTFVLNMVCCVVATFLYCILYWLLFVVFKSTEGGVMTFVYFYLPCAIYTSVISPLLWLIFKPIKSKLNKEIKIEE